MKSDYNKNIVGEKKKNEWLYSGSTDMVTVEAVEATNTNEGKPIGFSGSRGKKMKGEEQPHRRNEEEKVAQHVAK